MLYMLNFAYYQGSGEFYTNLLELTVYTHPDKLLSNSAHRKTTKPGKSYTRKKFPPQAKLQKQTLNKT